MNLTKTIGKVPIDLNLNAAGHAVPDHAQHPPGGPKYDPEDKWVSAAVQHAHAKSRWNHAV